MQGAFIQALTFSPPTVLGRPLSHFSAFHGLILEAAGSPYLMGGPAGLDDAVLGIWVCSHSFSDGFSAVGDSVAARKWGRGQKRGGLLAGAAEFRKYIDASFLAPQFWRPDGGGGEIKAPYFWHCATFAMRELRMTEQQAWDHPIARLACYQSCVAESKGNKDLMTADEIKALEVLRADEAKQRKTA